MIPNRRTVINIVHFVVIRVLIQLDFGEKENTYLLLTYTGRGRGRVADADRMSWFDSPYPDRPAALLTVTVNLLKSPR